VKYYTYAEPDINDSTKRVYNTYSEKEIVLEYWDYWYGEMCEKFGKEHVDEKYSKQECIDDWIVVNWAWEYTVEDNGKL
jgi:hypothetical protein